MRVAALLLVSLFGREASAVRGSPDSRTIPFPPGAIVPSGMPPTAPLPPRCPATGQHHFPDLVTCDGFYMCFEGVRMDLTCPDGMLYNFHTPSHQFPCDDAANVTCDLPTLPAPPVVPELMPVCLGEYNQHLPNPDSCSAFYECREGQTFLQLCPKGLLYNALSPDTRYPCDYPENVVCFSSSRPPPPLPPLPPLPPSGPSLPQQPQGREPDEPKKVFNFYTYVTNQW